MLRTSDVPYVEAHRFPDSGFALSKGRRVGVVLSRRPPLHASMWQGLGAPTKCDGGDAVARDDSERHSTVDPNLPYWIRQAAEFSGALGRTARSRRPIAIIAWILIAIMMGGLILGWVAQLRG